MKKLNKILIAILVLLAILAASITAFAVTKRTPAEIAADFAGKSVEEIVEERFESGKTYGQIAYEYDEDAWKNFRNEMLENKKAILDKSVDDGILSREEADEILKNIEEMQEYCIETGGGFGKGIGTGGFGNGNRSMGFGRGRCGGSW